MRTYIPKATCNMSRYANSEFHSQVKHIQTQLLKPEYVQVSPSPAQVMPLLQHFYTLLQESLGRNYSQVEAALVATIARWKHAIRCAEISTAWCVCNAPVSMVWRKTM